MSIQNAKLQRMIHVFLDTNILIHFRRFDQIDWKEVLNTQEPIAIVFAAIVISELDKHKYNSTRRVSQRAKKLLPFFEKIIEDSSCCKYEVRFLTNKPSETTFVNHKLDVKDADDNLLASIIEYARTIAKEDSVVYVTNDIGPRLKSKSLSISAIKPNEDDQISDPDELEQENQQLKKQVLELKNKTPYLEFTFSDDQNVLVAKRSRKMKTKDEFVEEQLRKIKEQYPPMSLRDSQNASQSMLSFSVSRAQISDYNDRLVEFYNEYLEYFESIYGYGYFKNNAIQVQFVLKNTGTSPGENIDVDLHFPDGFEVIAEGDVPEVSDEPKPPHKPKNPLDFQIPSIGHLNSMLNRANSPAGKINFPKPGPTIKKTNSYDVNFHVKTLKHHHKEALDILYAKFDDISKARGFTIDYRITAANIPLPVSGQLHIKFND
jgi:hypothetical protein